MLTQRIVAKTFGFVFLAIGLLGFVNNPILGLFDVNAAHNIVHVLSGLLALGAGFTTEAYSRMYNVGFGAVYALVTVLGFAGVGFVVDLLNLNTMDNVLHLLITVGLLGAGLGIPAQHQAEHAR